MLKLSHISCYLLSLSVLYLGEILSVLFSSLIFSLAITNLELISTTGFLLTWNFSFPRFIVVVSQYPYMLISFMLAFLS